MYLLCSVLCEARCALVREEKDGGEMGMEATNGKGESLPEPEASTQQDMYFELLCRNPPSELRRPSVPNMRCMVV